MTDNGYRFIYSSAYVSYIQDDEHEQITTREGNVYI